MLWLASIGWAYHVMRRVRMHAQHAMAWLTPMVITARPVARSMTAQIDTIHSATCSRHPGLLLARRQLESRYTYCLARSGALMTSPLLTGDSRRLGCLT